MHKTKHSIEVTNRFRDLVNDAGHSLADEHYDQLSLLIEAAIDTALVEKIEKIADKLNHISQTLRNDAEFFD